MCRLVSRRTVVLTSRVWRPPAGLNLHKGVRACGLESLEEGSLVQSSIPTTGDLGHHRLWNLL